MHCIPGIFIQIQSPDIQIYHKLLLLCRYAAGLHARSNGGKQASARMIIKFWCGTAIGVTGAVKNGVETD